MIKFRALRTIISSSLFWKFRHLLQPDWIKGYGGKKDRNFITNLVATSNVVSVLDYGCASGADLESIKNSAATTLVYGVDINAKAIDFCNSSFASKYIDGFYFSTQLEKAELNGFLERNNLSQIDLAIIDRVFYCLSEHQINQILELMSPVVNMIFIDDFYDEGDSYAGYKHRNWDDIFANHNYEPELNIETIYSKVEQANARTMVYRKLAE